MKLIRLELSNYRQHRKLSVDFAGPIIGLCGRNGSGKSHLLGALSFCLCGKAEGSRGNMVTWGESKGYAKLTVLHHGDTYRIKRNAHNSSATLTINDGEPVKGASKVNAEIESRLGVTDKLCRQAIFVRQNTIDAILFERPSDRMTSWLQLCGLGHTDTIHKTMGAVLGQLPDLTDWVPLLDQAKLYHSSAQSQVADARQALATAEAAAEALPKVAYSIPLIDEASRLVAAWSSANAERTNVGQAREAQVRKSAERARLVAANPRLAEVLVVLPQEIQQAQARLTELGGLIPQQQTLGRAHERLTAARTELEAYLASNGDEQNLKQQETEGVSSLEQWQAATAKLLSDLQMNTALQSALSSADGSTQTCPLCTSDLDGKDTAGLLEMVTARVTELQEGVTQSRAAQNQWSQLVARTRETLGQLARLTTEVGALAEGASAGTFDPAAMAKMVAEQGLLTRQVAAMQEDLQQKRAVESTIREIDAAGSTAEELVAGSQSRLDQATKLLTSFYESVDTSVFPTVREESPAADLQAARSEAQLADQALRQAAQTVTASQTQLDQALAREASAQEGITKLVDQRAAQVDYEAALKELRSARDWFHASNGPKEVISFMLDQVTGTVNSFLGSFGAAFKVVPDYETMGYRYYYLDERVTSEDYPKADELSGGERVVLATAFRLAAYCMFADDVGLLSLDEPTVFLDSQHIAQFSGLIQRIREIAQELDLQVLMATHEQGVLGSVDSIIELSPSKDA